MADGETTDSDMNGCDIPEIISSAHQLFDLSVPYPNI
jgi:hypothetical protein